MHIPSHPDANIELEEAVFFYEKRSEGLGEELLEDFERTIEKIFSNPTQYRKIKVGSNHPLDECDVTVLININRVKP